MTGKSYPIDEVLREKRKQDLENQRKVLSAQLNKPFDKSHPYYAPTTAAPGTSGGTIKFIDNGFALEIQKHELEIRQTEALCSLAEGVKTLSEFVKSGGLQSLFSGMARGNIAAGIFQGLAAKDGRKALDAQVIKQNAIDITYIIEAVFNKMHERATDKEPRDPEIKEPVESA